MSETKTIAARELEPGHIIIDPDGTEHTVRTATRTGQGEYPVVVELHDAATAFTLPADANLLVRADTATDAEFDV